MKYKFLDDLTSDVIFEAYGKDLKELFQNSALAMSEVICDIKNVSKKSRIDVEVKADNRKDLLYNWLQEIIAQIDIQEMFFSSFHIKKITDTELRARLFGESISPQKSQTVVKAVTNYKFGLRKTQEGYKATVSLDI
ncbi:hypothetical protein GF323_00940 [Candidatus Woesearchaeota archaeon]|nr:hypothetical protein [Candidatus Woesearchaeota archaeon]